VQIIRASTCRTTPWKNGGGSTTEIAVEPSGASLNNFDWRISMARVASDGPFSEFAGIDRTLAVVSGSGLSLTIGSDAPVLLGRGSDPIRFAGDVPVSARLSGDEITDINVMTRRGRFGHRLRRLQGPALCDFDGHDVAIAIAVNGSAKLISQGQAETLGVTLDVTLGDGDAAILGPASDASFRIEPAAECDCYLVLLRQHCDQPG
jgi:environmental stress-induced protein Ves